MNWPPDPAGSAAYGQSIVPAQLTNVVAISAGGFSSMALKSDGSVVTWGSYAPPNVLVAAVRSGDQELVAVSLRNDSEF